MSSRTRRKITDASNANCGTIAGDAPADALNLKAVLHFGGTDRSSCETAKIVVFGCVLNMVLKL